MLEAIAARIEGKTYTPADLAQLVAEVERLRGAIQAHREAMSHLKYVSKNHYDKDLWAVLDA